jgi:hypothetical protein
VPGCAADASHIDATMTRDLTDDEVRAFATHLKQVLDIDPDPLAPRLARLQINPRQA